MDLLPINLHLRFLRITIVYHFYLSFLYFADVLEHAICLYQVNYSSASISKPNY
jgi:hypothetical protein